MSIIETESLTRRFGKLIAVDALTLSVESGEVFGLLGANGRARRPPSKCSLYCCYPTSGAARVAGFDISRDAADVNPTS